MDKMLTSFNGEDNKTILTCMCNELTGITSNLQELIFILIHCVHWYQALNNLLNNWSPYSIVFDRWIHLYSINDIFFGNILYSRNLIEKTTSQRFKDHVPVSYELNCLYPIAGYFISARFHNEFIQLEFNPKYFTQNYTLFKPTYQECLKQTISIAYVPT